MRTHSVTLMNELVSNNNCDLYNCWKIRTAGGWVLIMGEYIIHFLRLKG